MTKFKTLAAIVPLMTLAFAVPTVAQASQFYSSATIAYLVAPSYNANCVWIRLQGVATADPAFPGVAAIGIPGTQIGFDQVYALLISAQLTGATVQVATTGAAAGGDCGSTVGLASVALSNGS